MQFAPQYHKGISGGFSGSPIQMFGEAVKRLDRLAPNLVKKSPDSFGNGHKYNSPLTTTGDNSGGGGVGGHQFKSGNAAKRMDRLAPN